MATTVHVPPALLKSVDRRAKALGLSRNRLIVRALERVVSDRSGWAPEFLHKLRHADPVIAEAVDRLVADVTSARRSKRGLRAVTAVQAPAIAAHALALGATLVTSNVEHMARVPGIRVEDWGQ